MSDTDDKKPEEQPPIRLKIKRRNAPDQPPYWQEYERPFVEGERLDRTLRECNSDGKVLQLPEFCDDESCGRCAMNINGEPALLCRVKHGDVDEPIEIRPLEVLPIVADLIVDRTAISAKVADLDRHGCIECGLCLEACPSYSPDDNVAFAGASAIFRAEQSNASARELGVHECDNTQNCVVACPKDLPLFDAIAAHKRRALKRLFGGG